MNLFETLPPSLAEELVDVLVDHSAVRIQRIVSTGHRSPDGFWYDQDQHEWVVVLKGTAELLFADDDQPLCLRVRLRCRA